MEGVGAVAEVEEEGSCELAVYGRVFGGRWRGAGHLWCSG